MSPDAPGALDEVRAEIDRIDAQIVQLIADRGRQVARAGGLKGSVAEVPAPERVEAVIRKVRSLANSEGADADLVETVYRTMIAEFIALETRQVSQAETESNAR